MDFSLKINIFSYQDRVEVYQRFGCWLLLFSLLFPHAFDGSVNQVFLLVKGLSFLVSLILIGIRLHLLSLLIGVFVLILGCFGSFYGNMAFTRLILYSIIFVIFSANIPKVVDIERYQRFYIFILCILSIFSLFFPSLITNIYGWNSFQQAQYFVGENKFVSIYGLHSTAATSFFIIFCALHRDNNIFSGKFVNVQVEENSTLTRGKTVTDWVRVTDREPNCNVMINANSDKFFSILKTELKKLN